MARYDGTTMSTPLTSAVVRNSRSRFTWRSAAAGRHRLLLLHRIRVAVQCRRNVGDGSLGADAVPGVVERRRDDRDAEVARRDGNDAAADTALGGQASVIEPLAAIVVEARGRHDREHVRDIV